MNNTDIYTAPPSHVVKRDGYVVIRKSTLAWLLERHRAAGQVDVPHEVALDLGENVVDVDAPVPSEDRLRTLGPILSIDQHRELLEYDEVLSLPKDVNGGMFWRMVAAIVHTMLANEGRAALQILGGKDE